MADPKQGGSSKASQTTYSNAGAKDGKSTFLDAVYALADPAVLAAMIGTGGANTIPTENPMQRARSPMNASAQRGVEKHNAEMSLANQQIEAAKIQNAQARQKKTGGGIGGLATGPSSGMGNAMRYRDMRQTGEIQNDLALQQQRGQADIEAELQKKLLAEKIAQIKALLSGLGGGGKMAGKMAGKTTTTKNTSSGSATEFHNVGGRPTAFVAPSQSTQTQTASSSGIDLDQLLNMFL